MNDEKRACTTADLFVCLFLQYIKLITTDFCLFVCKKCKKEKNLKRKESWWSPSHIQVLYIYILDEEKKVMKNRHNSGKGKQQ